MILHKNVSIYRCPSDDLGFSSFAAAANASTPFSSMPYLKTSPYLMTVDPLHSMGYGSSRKFIHFIIFFIVKKQNNIFISSIDNFTLLITIVIVLTIVCCGKKKLYIRLSIAHTHK